MRRLLLLSASVLSLAVAQAPAMAQTAAPPTGWYLSTEGAVVFGNSEVRSGDSVARNDLGFRGAVSFGRRFDPLIDWRVNLAWTRFRDGVSDTNGTVMTSRFEYAMADLEVGHSVAVGDPLTNLRVFAGVRALYAKDSVDKVGNINNERHSKFAGIGPRVGVEAEKRMADSPWGLSASASGAAVFGTRKSTDKTGITTSTSETALNLEGAIGIDYHTSPASKITAGVRAAQWTNIHGADSNLNNDTDNLSWGPFVKFELKM